MISLQDKIQKFEKLIYNKDLDDFIPIDEQFIGGGITMQSLIKENAFIVEEIKKMKNVFVNYCKLNKTVYQKITQHEIALHTETNKLQNISTSVEARLTDAIKQVKEMYEEMKYESVRTKNLVDQAVKPIEQAINRKVDETSFTMHMKRIIAELEQDNSQEGGNQNSSLSPDDLQFRKKKGKSVAQEQYEAEKAKNTKLFLQMSQKIEELQIKNRQFDPILYKNSAAISKLTLTVDNHQTQVFKLTQNLKEVRAQINNTEQRLINEIHTRTSDNVWEVKLSSFESKNVIPRFQNLSGEISKNQRQNNRHFADLEPRFNKINQKVTQLFQESDKNQTQIRHLNHDLSELNKKIADEIKVIEEKLGVVYNEKKAKIQQINQKIDAQINVRIKEIQAMNVVIKDLSKTIEDKVVAGVKKNINIKIQQIDKNIHSLTNKQKELKQQIFFTKGQIHNIKQVLSKKANFTDILVHFQRKADKEDFKELKDRIQVTTPSHLKSTIIDNPQRTRRTISANSRKRTSLSKNIMNPVSVLNDDKMSLDSDNDRSSRLFIMGLQSDMAFQSDRRRMSYTESTRRKKKMKQNTGILNMFGN